MYNFLIVGIQYTHNEFGPFINEKNRIDFVKGKPKPNGRARYFYDAIENLGGDGAHELGGHCHKGSDHGTHVAALAGGRTCGVARGATLYSVRVLDCKGKGSETNIIKGLNHAVDEILKSYKRGVINLSLGDENWMATIG